MFLMVKTAYCDELKRLFYMKSVKEVELTYQNNGEQMGHYNLCLDEVNNNRVPISCFNYIKRLKGKKWNQVVQFEMGLNKLCFKSAENINAKEEFLYYLQQNNLSLSCHQKIELEYRKWAYVNWKKLLTK